MTSNLYKESSRSCLHLGLVSTRHFASSPMQQRQHKIQILNSGLLLSVRNIKGQCLVLSKANSVSHLSHQHATVWKQGRQIPALTATQAEPRRERRRNCSFHKGSQSELLTYATQLSLRSHPHRGEQLTGLQRRLGAVEDDCALNITL